MEVMAHLGYPAYFVSILGVWRVLGDVAVLAPRLPRLKEWAYVGLFTASWALRPESRKLRDASGSSIELFQPTLLEARLETGM
jgi:hypothetical protein